MGTKTSQHKVDPGELFYPTAPVGILNGDLLIMSLVL